ncbi:type IV secretory system conjugative DNA transfer family protein [Pseudomonas sp. KHPS1]|nr:type IV secretory system conjugative DNA transfer family protein [Pseudomonas sp. KHPS1]ATH80275.1 conjugal transfer protein TraG [Pseudomonas mendocina]UTH36152.1 type IV secretory system conjugative DNA transfer family protein [Pseudomonas sp. KHPS1]
MKHNNAVGPQIRGGRRIGASPWQAVLAIFFLLTGLATATQYFAHLYGQHAALGGNLGGVYAPWMILIWAGKWSGQYQDTLLRAGSLGVLVAAAGMMALVIVRLIQRNSATANAFLHGSARWGERKDIEDAGLLADEGVYVGAWLDKRNKLHYLRHNGPEHILTFAPTRSGKGVGLVIPTLLSWKHSAVITDLKGELWALSAGWRQKHAGNRVLRFEPATAQGCVGWNPLEEIRLGTEYEVGDVQNLATLIVDPDGKGLNDHWQKTSQAMLVGCILHLCYRSLDEGGVASLPALDAMLADPSRPIDELWQEMTHYGHLNGENHPLVGSAARDMLDRPAEEAGSVLSTAKSYLSLFRDPIVARNVSRSEFKIRDLMNHDDPLSLYIITQPNDKARLRPLVRILVNMIVRLLADKMDFEDGRPKAHYKHRLLMMLDEFPSLGKLDIMQESLAFVAGYGIKCYLIVQDLSQLQEFYGQNESITSNCHIQNAYPPNRVETAEHLSKLTGQTTIVKEQITTSGRRSSALLGQVSRTIQEVQRPLLTTDEALRMPGPRKDSQGNIQEAGDMVIYCAGYPAFYGKQPLYFQDSVFLARAKVHAPRESDRTIEVSLAAER